VRLVLFAAYSLLVTLRPWRWKLYIFPKLVELPQYRQIPEYSTLQVDMNITALWDVIQRSLRLPTFRNNVLPPPSSSKIYWSVVCEQFREVKGQNDWLITNLKAYRTKRWWPGGYETTTKSPVRIILVPTGIRLEDLLNTSQSRYRYIRVVR
jgi:hypothetical protein